MGGGCQGNRFTAKTPIMDGAITLPTAVRAPERDSTILHLSLSTVFTKKTKAFLSQEEDLSETKDRWIITSAEGIDAVINLCF